jgi:hypothetical protein
MLVMFLSAQQAKERIGWFLMKARSRSSIRSNRLACLTS